MGADISYIHNQQAKGDLDVDNLYIIALVISTCVILKTNKLNKKISLVDFLKFLREINKIWITGIWHNAEITKKFSEILNSEGIIII